jgi:hypothetical protein
MHQLHRHHGHGHQHLVCRQAHRSLELHLELHLEHQRLLDEGHLRQEVSQFRQDEVLPVSKKDRLHLQV